MWEWGRCGKRSRKDREAQIKRWERRAPATIILTVLSSGHLDLITVYAEIAPYLATFVL